MAEVEQVTASTESVVRDLDLARLAHFTPAKNLPHIIRDGMLRSSKDLADHAPEYFQPTDRERFDQQPDKLCCSFHFPNPYYLKIARAKSEFKNYPDWVCFLLGIDLVHRLGALFSTCNAAKGSGAHLEAGPDALSACFDDSVQPSGTTRGSSHHPLAATDLQAEALIPGPVDLSQVQGIVVPSDEAASEEVGRLETLGLEPFEGPWIIAPDLFSRSGLRNLILGGDTSDEREWQQNG